MLWKRSCINAHVIPECFNRGSITRWIPAPTFDESLKESRDSLFVLTVLRLCRRAAFAGMTRSLLGALVIFCLFLKPAFSAQEEIPVYGRVPDFVFQDQDGKEFRLADLNGLVWIADFIFTRCQGQCPLMSGRMKQLRRELATTDTYFVSFSVDPEYDTPEVLSKYAQPFRMDEGVWFFLTGDKRTMWGFIQEGFQLGVGEPTVEDLANGAEPVMHSNRFVLIDKEGRIRGYYDSSEPAKMKQLVKDATKLTMNWSLFPPLNAGLNATSGLLIVLGFIMIKQRAWTGHALCMCLALLVSALFLVSYLYYHYHHGSTPFPYQGWRRPVYFTILISHTILAVTVLPLALTSLYQALRSRFDKHVRVAKITFPIWLYVSITGVVIYWMLYQM